MSPSLPHPRRRTITAALGACLALVATLPATATGAAPSSPRSAAAAPTLVVDGRQVTRETEPRAARGLLDASPAPAPARPTARAARSRGKAIDLRVVRRKINASGGSAQQRYAARAALTSADRVRRAAKARSQARRELDGLLKTTTLMARGNRITRDRLPMLTTTLARNAEWWKLGRATASGQRVRFDGSEMVWQLYPGSGLQLQWLGTFGRGNGFALTPGPTARAQLTTLVDEALTLAVPRAGGTAWEYFFPFGGGAPPWVSGMAQATGVQVLSRAATNLTRPELLEEAKTATAILKTAPPSGVQIVEGSGTHFLIYSFATRQKVLNAMTQTVNGLYAYVLAQPADVDARLLLLDGLRWLDNNVGRYMTGSWSRYALGGPRASRHYETVARDFLRTLCSLLNRDAATPGGGPSGAYPATRICQAADTLTKYLGS